MAYRAGFDPRLPPAAAAAEVRYVRTAAGSDLASGRTPGTAWESLERGLSFLIGQSTRRPKTLDVSDCVFNEAAQINLPALLGGYDGDLDGAAAAPNNYIYRTPGQIRAAQTLQQSITVTNVDADPVTGLVTLTVTEALVPGAHVGQLVIGGVAFEWGAVWSNTANQIVCASLTGAFTAPVGLYLPSCTWTFGDGGNIFQQASYAALFSHFAFTGIDFRAPDPKASLVIFPLMPWHAALCRFEGLILEGGAQHGVMDACHITRRYGQNGASVTVRNSFFDGCEMNNHGDGANGQHDLRGCVFDGCEPVLSGNFESRMGIQMNRCEIANATAQGLIFRGAPVGSMSRTRIRDSAAEGILVDAPVRLHLDQVVGNGNADHGVVLRNGAQLEATGGTSLTGAAGDVDLGGAGTTAWGAAPATDGGAVAPQFCRIF